MKPHHLTAFECLMPWVGDFYDNDRHLRLLVIGESHYFPPKSTIHHDAKRWYFDVNESDLSYVERSYIFTAGILQDAIDNNFNIRPYGIFREIAKILAHKLNTCDRKKALSHCMFMNFFQRPAQETGQSINEKIIDIDIAEKTLEWALKEYNPELVAIVSKKAGQYACKVLENHRLPYCITPHPTCSWWNRRSHNGQYGREILPDFLEQKKWIRY